MYRVMVRVGLELGGVSRLFQLGVTKIVCNPRVTNRLLPIWHYTVSLSYLVT